MPRNFPAFWAVNPEAIDARAEMAPRPSAPIVADDGIVRLDIRGPVLRKMRVGYASWEEVEARTRQATADPAVRGVLYLIDSPGGDVSGMQAAAYAVRRMREAGKVAAAFVDGGQCNSAAFYFGLSTGNLWATPMGLVGGTGVLVPIDTDPADPAVVSKLTPAKHLPDTDPRAQAAIQQAADDLAGCMLADMATWAGLPNAAAAALFYGEGAVLVATRAFEAGMIHGLSMEPPLHLFQPAGPAPADPKGAPMDPMEPEAEAEVIPTEAEATEEPAAAEPVAMTAEEIDAKIAELQALKAKMAPPAPDMPQKAAAFSADLVAKGFVLPAKRGEWERDYQRDPHATALKALALKPALHTVATGDARREAAPLKAGTKQEAEAAIKARAAANKTDYMTERAQAIAGNPGLRAILEAR